MIPKRGFRYHCALMWRDYLIGLPGLFFEAVSHLLCPIEMTKGFRVMDPWPETRSHFSKVVDAAVDVIAQSDPVRFRRVQAEIRSIVNGPAIVGSTYGRPLRVCSVDLRCFSDPDSPELAVQLFASALVREATVGHLANRGILRTRQNRLRFDHLCCEEARRFLHRLGMTKTPYDPECLTTLPRGAFWGIAMKEIHGVFVRNSAPEAPAETKAGAHNERKQ